LPKLSKFQIVGLGLILLSSLVAVSLYFGLSKIMGGDQLLDGKEKKAEAVGGEYNLESIQADILTRGTNNQNDKVVVQEVVNQEFQLYIPKLNIDVPVVANVSGVNKKEYLKELTKGVVHQKGTKLPNENGNTVIFGHSSQIPGIQDSHYSEIFATLNDLEVGDEIFLVYKQTRYAFQVKQKKVVLPTEVSILTDTNFPRLTIYTCWPLKTDAKRLVIVAE
jgi:sortase A